MGDYRTARVMSLVRQLEAYRPHPEGRSGLVDWVVDQLNACPMSAYDAEPGDDLEQSIIRSYPGYLDNLRRS